MNSEFSKIKDLIKDLPEGPGVYQFFDHKGEIIYVGKAKNLKSRVSSYFNKKSHDSYKSKVLSQRIHDIKYIVVDSESDALLLENNLIKKYQPKYNVLLKDDKTFPWICIKNEPFPRIFLTRNLIQDGSKYFGPYTSAITARTLISLMRQIYKLRTCRYDLRAENIINKKYKVCLEYHIENCLGPCEGLQDENSYNESIRQIQEILKGNLSGVISFLEAEMKNKADSYQFEDAEILKQKFNQLKKFQTKSTIVNPSINNVDVYSIVSGDKYAIVNYLNITEGAVVQAHNVEIKKRLNESTSEILVFAIIDMADRVHSSAKELILPINLNQELPWYKITVPQRGDKKKLLDLSFRNAKRYNLERVKRSEKSKVQYSNLRILEAIKNDLRLNAVPNHIECFDNSNIQGTNPVAACVVFRNGMPAKKEYRHYNIKTVAGADDYASMKEVIYRRYRRLIEEERETPQLIIIDGGKGQLNAGIEGLKKLGIEKKIAIIGIAKKLEEIYFPDDPVPLYIDKNSITLKVIQHLRNEAHRFGIQFHRLKRSNNQLQSELESIPGIGAKSIETLFKHFKSIGAVKNASKNTLEEILDMKKANAIIKYFSDH